MQSSPNMHSQSTGLGPYTPVVSRKVVTLLRREKRANLTENILGYTHFSRPDASHD